MLHIALHQPEIPPNTGNIARLCFATQSRLHLIGPLGFSLDERSLRRAGMDYWHQCDIHLWESLEHWFHNAPFTRFYLLTTKASKPYWSATFQDGDAFLFGRESRGLPESLLAKYPTHCLTIPMRNSSRSLNLATAVAIVLYEAIRQTSLT